MATIPPPVLTPYPGTTGDPWPVGSWPRSAMPEGVVIDGLLEEAFDESGPLSTTYAVVVVHHGSIVAERYGGALPSFTHAPTPVEPTTPLLSWSMAKSMLSVLVGMLVSDGALSLDAAVSVPEWPDGDPRAAITLRQLLEMRDGLDFVEDYVDERASDVITMLFGDAAADMAHFAADRPLAAAPGTRFNYSSGTTNIISRIVTDALGGTEAMRRTLAERLFGPLAMDSADPRFDEAGTFIASSYVYATAEDFARFGLLLCRGGRVGDRQLVEESWIDYLRTPRSIDEDDGWLYSAQCWVNGDDLGSFGAHGYEGQRIVACPPLDLVLVRLGSTPAERKPFLDAWETAMIDAFRPTLDR